MKKKDDSIDTIVDNVTITRQEYDELIEAKNAITQVNECSLVSEKIRRTADNLEAIAITMRGWIK